LPLWAWLVGALGLLALSGGGILLLLVILYWPGQTPPGTQGVIGQTGRGTGQIVFRPGPANPQTRAGPVQPTTPTPPAGPPPRDGRDEANVRGYLRDLPEFDLGPFPAGWSFGKAGSVGSPGKDRITVGGQAASKGLGLHPPEKSFSSVKYRIEPADVFQAGVA